MCLLVCEMNVKTLWMLGFLRFFIVLFEVEFHMCTSIHFIILFLTYNVDGNKKVKYEISMHNRLGRTLKAMPHYEEVLIDASIRESYWIL